MPPPEKGRSRWPWGRETLGKQDSLPWHKQQAGGKTSVTRSLRGEMEAWMLRKHEGTSRAEACAPSEEGVWAEGRPVLCLWSQRDSISLATCPKGRLGLATSCHTRNSQKPPHGETGSQMPSSTKMWQ